MTMVTLSENRKTFASVPTLAYLVSAEVLDRTRKQGSLSQYDGHIYYRYIKRRSHCYCCSTQRTDLICTLPTLS